MKRLLVAAALLTTIAACQSKTPQAAGVAQTAQTIEEHFVGTLPCADCKGIDAELTLYRDAKTNAPDGYEFSETYAGTGEDADEDDAMGTEGDWEIQTGSAKDPNATVIALMPEDGSKTRYFLKVSDQELRELDDKKAELDAQKTATLIRK